MGSIEGIRFHLRATHKLTDSTIDGMCALQKAEAGVVGMEAVARIHHAMHEAAKVVADLEAVTDGSVMCTECGDRSAVVILTTDKLCRPCALIAGERVGRGFNGN